MTENISNGQSVELLINDIHKVFFSVSRPEMGNIIFHRCKECESVELVLLKKKWMDLSDEIIESIYDKLPLLSHQAFHYFFPAFLRYSLYNFDPNSVVCQFTIYAVTPGKMDDNKKDWWKERFLVFSNEEMKIIFQFLDLVMTDERFYDYHTIVERGKKRLEELLCKEI